MKNFSRYWWMLLGATASGLLAGYVALVYVSEEPAPLEAATPSRTIVVASRDLSAGAIVRREDVEMLPWPGSAIPDGFTVQAGEVVGRGLIVESTPTNSGRWASSGEIVG
jgi:Flp pilus assembly protein CpaB